MDIVKFAITKPVTVTVGVLLVVMFGLIGLGFIPIQLVPTVDLPLIQVETYWPGRSPQEVIDEITKEQEERLKNVAGLKKMQSVSRQGQAEINLEFVLGTDIDRARQEVSDALRQVPDYPDEVTEPTVVAADSGPQNAIAWIIIDVDPSVRDRFPDFDITTIQDGLDKEVKPYLERIDGVAEVNIFGGREREIRVLVDPTALAQRSLSAGAIVTALRQRNVNISGGTIAEGKRDYRVRVIGQYDEPSEILDTMIAFRNGKPVYIRDVATVEAGYVKRRGFVRSLGEPSIAMNLIRRSGANVMDVMSDLRERLVDVEQEILPGLDPEVGQYLRLRHVYDETTYISSAIHLVKWNLWVGGLLAGAVLLLFLRSIVSTGVIMLVIPISVIGTFLVLLGFGRSLNVVSLAGLAFAVGMVVDNAIVVLENIYRRIQMGETPMVAAYRGGKEVWGAILASTLTTVAVFVPILTIQEEAGQLFRDIALAIVASVVLSLIVSITVIPAACSRWLRLRNHATEPKLIGMWHELFGLAPIFAKIVNTIGSVIMWMITGWRGYTVRPAMIVLLTVVSLLGAYKLMPPMDYLPAGNRNIVFGGLLIPPGQSVEQMESIAERIEAQLEPYHTVDFDDPDAVAALPPIARGFPGMPDAPPPFDPVGMNNMFIGSFAGNMFIGATSVDDQVVIPIGQLVTNSMNTIPDAFGGAQQSSLFGRGIGGGNSINLEVSGPRLDRVIAAADMMFFSSAGRFGFGNVRPSPSNFNLEQSEYRVRLNDAGREMGLTTQQLGTAIRALFDGAFAGDFRLDGENIDLMVLPAGGRLEQKEDLAQIPVTTPAGRVVPLDTILEFAPSTAPQEIERVEELAAVTIRITPPQGRAIEELMDEIEREIIEPARAAGLIDRTMRVRLEGTAAKLDEVKAALFGTRSETIGAFGSVMRSLSVLLMLAGGAVCVFAGFKALRGHGSSAAYGAAGALFLGLILGGLFFALGDAPYLATARFIWALAVVYLLMCALFESFIYPFVIMFSVPLAIVGGFLGLSIVHGITMRDPTVAPQQLDVLTMLGFVILIGVVVNNAILIVHQGLNFMRGEHGEEPREAHIAIADAVRTRIRPIFMSSLTSVGGMLPLVLYPGAGSEMYRGLGSVVIGGLLCSTVFTLILVPMMFSLVLDMRDGLRGVLGLKERSPAELMPAIE